jgi:DNA-binding NarL/FixJ family response regulator
MATKKIRILTVDDHPILRSGIAAELLAEEDIELVGEASNGIEAIASFRALRLMNGLDAIVAIRSEFPDARLVVLTTYQGDVQALRALKAGAMGYLLKNMLRAELVDTIRTVFAGNRRIPKEIAAVLAEHVTDDALSEREIEVLRSVAMGSSNKIIASHLGVSEATVKSHLRNILSKLGANDRTHAVTIAIKRGLIDG